MSIDEGISRIEANDTHQFTKDFVTVPNSASVSIWHDDATLITSLQTATQSGASANFYYFHTTTNSWYTTVDSSGIFYLEWTAYRATGNNITREYFEVIQTD